MGGTPQTICEAPGAAAGTWSKDGTILYSVLRANRTALFRVPASGGTPAPVTVRGDNGRELESAYRKVFFPMVDSFSFAPIMGTLDEDLEPIRTPAPTRPRESGGTPAESSVTLRSQV